MYPVSALTGKNVVALRGGTLESSGEPIQAGPFPDLARSRGVHLHWEVVRNDVTLAIPSDRGQTIGRGDPIE